MNEADVRQCIDMKEQIEARLIEMASYMSGRDVESESPTIYWPEGDEDSFSIAWTEYGGWGSEWDYSEHIPIHWLWSDDWREQADELKIAKHNAEVEERRLANEEEEREEREDRRAQYLELKEEFGDV